MEYVNLGKTKLLVSRTALCTQAINQDSLIREAYENGINFFDTTHADSKNEEILGASIYDIRKNVIISTKTQTVNAEQVLSDLHKSLESLNTDYIDIFQLIVDSYVPKTGSSDKIFDILQKARKDGKIRYIGLVSTSRLLCLDAALSGLYDTIQYPLSETLSQEDIDLVKFCDQTEIGFIANTETQQNLSNEFSFIRQFENAVPVWTLKTEEDLQQIISFEANPPAFQ